MFKWFGRRLRQLDQWQADGKKPKWYRGSDGNVNSHWGKIVSWHLHYYNLWSFGIDYLFWYRFEDGRVTRGFMNPIKEYRKAKFMRKVVERLIAEGKIGEKTRLDK